MEHLLWTERYRPKTVEDCILPSRLKQPFQEYVNQKQIPNLLLTGGAGVGKTTVAKALCNEIGCDFMVINGSDESGIDIFRTKIKNYASSMSFSGGRKVIIIDEADYLNPNSTQPALRNAIEEYASNCSFIFTCNYKNRIIEPLHSRCAVVDFSLKNGEKAKMAAAFFKRIQSILQSEKVEYDDAVIAELIYGDNAKDYFDEAVRFVIILIVLVFDPLAVLLLIAANVSYMNANKPKEPKKVATKEKKKYTKAEEMKSGIYNFMMKDDFGIQTTDKAE